MSLDPLIEDVRKARRQISQECGHDIWQLYARYQQIQKKAKEEGKTTFINSPAGTCGHTSSSRRE